MAFLIKASVSGRCFLFQYYQLSLSRVNCGTKKNGRIKRVRPFHQGGGRLQN